MKKTSIFLLAALALAGCAKNERLGGEAPAMLGDGSIGFSFLKPAATRADMDHAASAAALDEQFIVWGEKNESGLTAPAAGNLVFNDYQVNYVAGTANSTTSNTHDWEYVGYAHTANYHSHIIPSFEATVPQTIKYWDFSATNYVFTAVSAKQTEIESGDVTITKTTSVSSPSTVYDKGYTLALTTDATLDGLYFSDRNELTSYGSVVTMRFRRLGSKIRVAMYETVPGYSVKIDKFYYVDNAAPTFADMTTATTTNFAANVPNVGAGVANNLTVTYYSTGVLKNQPKVSGDATAANYVTLGTKINEATALGTSSATATYDQTDKAYTSVFPQETNAKNLLLKVDYTLTSTDGSGEVIKVTGATAEVPAIYLQWKSNYNYTYLFKISQNTNGTTDDGTHVGLYPITFDAVVVEDLDGIQETITTVATPSITTYAKGAIASEYAVDANIYVSLENPGAATLTAANSKLYTAEIETGAAQELTESAIANALVNYNGVAIASSDVATVAFAAGDALDCWKLDGGLYFKYKGTATAADVTAQAAEPLTFVTIADETKATAYIVKDALGKLLTVTPSTLSIVTAIDAADAPEGVAISGNFAMFTPAAAGTYVFEYNDGAKKHYKKIIVQ